VLKIGVMAHHPDSAHTDPRRLRRAFWIVGLLFSVTTLALLLAWSHPQSTIWHFLGVTQLLPLFYLALSVWAAWPVAGEAEE
jgi:preprotein translocase subunit SecG